MRAFTLNLRLHKNCQAQERQQIPLQGGGKQNDVIISEGEIEEVWMKLIETYKVHSGVPPASDPPHPADSAVLGTLVC